MAFPSFSSSLYSDDYAEDKPICPYGTSCYRTHNKDHVERYLHVGEGIKIKEDEEEEEQASGGGGVRRSRRASSIASSSHHRHPTARDRSPARTKNEKSEKKTSTPTRGKGATKGRGRGRNQKVKQNEEEEEEEEDEEKKETKLPSRRSVKKEEGEVEQETKQDATPSKTTGRRRRRSTSQIESDEKSTEEKTADTKPARGRGRGRGRASSTKKAASTKEEEGDEAAKPVRGGGRGRGGGGGGGRSASKKAATSEEDAKEEHQEEKQTRGKKRGRATKDEEEEQDKKPPTKKKAKTDTSASSDSGDGRIVINRAPVLALWATLVAMHVHGISFEEAATMGSAITGMFAQAKGKSIGKFESKPRKTPAERERILGDHRMMNVMGRSIPVRDTKDGVLALSKGKPISSESAVAYIKKSFGDSLERVRTSMERLIRAYAHPSDLDREAYDAYVEFRPGSGAWGAKGTLHLETIEEMAKTRG